MTRLNGKQRKYDPLNRTRIGMDELDDIQTLCIKCDKIKTAQDAKDIAKQRRIDKILTKGQVRLKG